VLTATAIVVLLVAGITVSTYLAVMASRAQNREAKARVVEAQQRRKAEKSDQDTQRLLYWRT
jgi:hypothetical protein